LSPSAIHGVAGFGRIETLTSDEAFPSAEEMTALEMSAIEHMNHDHAEAIHLYATKVLKAQPGPWRILAIDPDGADLGLDEQSLRLEFQTPVFTADALRKKFAELAYEARTVNL
jgi:heme iron utilization protein